MLKKTILAAAAMCLLAAVTVCDSFAADISAASAIVIEAETGEVLFEKNPDKQMLIASTTKIVTALVALENSEPNSIVTVPQECVGTEGSSLYLKAGEQLPLKELLYGLMLESGNDAAVAIAIHVSGSVDKFVDKMNEKAQALGCTNTHFANPNGLDADGHYSSARDLAKIMANAMENELFAQIVSTKSISFSGRSFQNHNKLLWSCDGVIGGKTGYTKSAGRTLVSCAERDGMRLICVTLNDSDDWNDHINLYDEMFSEWEIFDVSNGVSLPTVPVVSGKTDTVSLRTSEITRLLVQKGETPEISFELPSFVYATVQKGDTAGYMKVAYGGKEYSAQLIFNETVERDPALKLSLLEKIKRGFAGLVYKSFSGLGYEPETNKD